MIENIYKVFAIVGKGGVGKTTFTAVFSQVLMKKEIHPLLIDADPTMSHLVNTMGIKSSVKEYKSIEEIRRDIIQTAIKGSTEEKKMIAESIDSIIEKSIITITNDKGAFSLLSMGQPQQAGCFCASNNLLRDIVEDVIHKYPIVLIDCEAGIEQINRKVIQSVDYLLIITDLSTRSIETAQNIHNMAKQFTKFRKAGIIINRVKKGLDVYNYPQIRDLDIPIIGILPDDDCLLDIELNSKDLLQLSEDSVYYKAIVDLQF